MIFFIFGLYPLILGRLLVEYEEVLPINHRNKNRIFRSFSDEECWHHLRFRIAELAELYILCNFPAAVVCVNGTSCPGEHGFALMLYRLAYPSRLTDLQDIFGREFYQLSRFSINLSIFCMLRGICYGIPSDSICIARLLLRRLSAD